MAEHQVMLQHYISQPSDGGASSHLTVSDDLDGMATRAVDRSGGRFVFVVGLSALLHASVAAALLLGTAPDHPGGGATELDVISVSITSAPDAQSAASMSAPEAPEADNSSDATVSPPERTIEPPDPLPPTLTQDTALPAAPPVLDKPETPGPPPNSPMNASAQTKDAGQTGSVATVPASVGGNIVGAAASRGDMDRYARDVALVVARKRPKGVGLKGTLTVEFTLSPASGNLLKSTVLKSSGSAKLDGLALSAIEKAKYPIPPVGMTATQLTYRVPFTFD
jgi:TonB family protein